MIELYRYYLRQAQQQHAPAMLFKKTPILNFEVEQKTCPIDGHRLYIQKTCERHIKSIGIGTFTARFPALYCKKHPRFGSWRPEELDTLVASNSNVAYNVIVEIGKLRFMENRQVKEIRSILCEDQAINLSTSEIELLIDKFVFYLAAVHQQSHELIKEQIKKQGGYILHLDSTCEGDSPKITSSFDAVSGFVLYSAKLTSENKDEIACFLKTIQDHFGSPHAIVSDMSKGIEIAVLETFGNIRHYICHYHFLAAVGKSLFEKEHDSLRQALSRAGISGALKTLRRKMNKSIVGSTVEKIDMHLTQPQQLGKTQQATELLIYYLILWILDYSSDGNGYGFPFDQRYLNLYERLQEAQMIINAVTSYYPVKTENDNLLWKLYHIIKPVVDNASIKSTVASYKIKLAVFTDLRHALEIAPETVHNGLTQESVISSTQELNRIQTKVKKFMADIEKKTIKTTDRKIQNSYENVKERLEKSWHRLFADPLIVNVKGEKKLFFVHRTNNIMEKHFRQLNYRYRRIHGNRSVRRNLENIPEQLPLVENLNNPNYLQLVFQDETKIAQRFSEINVKEIRKVLIDHRNKKQVLCSRQTKHILRLPEFKQRLVSAFSTVAA
ncbi:MAG: hypothetical protein JW976_09000 [Syntrophaceae bacterium]|nr:hypothetical protein [Syntrophaceae bacterium]